MNCFKIFCLVCLFANCFSIAQEVDDSLYYSADEILQNIEQDAIHLSLIVLQPTNEPSAVMGLEHRFNKNYFDDRLLKIKENVSFAKPIKVYTPLRYKEDGAIESLEDSQVSNTISKEQQATDYFLIPILYNNQFHHYVKTHASKSTYYKYSHRPLPYKQWTYPFRISTSKAAELLNSQDTPDLYDLTTVLKDITIDFSHQDESLFWVSGQKAVGVMTGAVYELNNSHNEPISISNFIESSALATRKDTSGFYGSNAKLNLKELAPAIYPWDPSRRKVNNPPISFLGKNPWLANIIVYGFFSGFILLLIPTAKLLQFLHSIIDERKEIVQDLEDAVDQFLNR